MLKKTMSEFEKVQNDNNKMYETVRNIKRLKPT